MAEEVNDVTQNDLVIVYDLYNLEGKVLTRSERKDIANYYDFTNPGGK